MKLLADNPFEVVAPDPSPNPHVIMVWDADGVHYQWTRHFNRHCGRDPEEVWESFSHYKSWGMTTEEFLRLNEEFCNAGGFGLTEDPPYPEAVETFNQIQRGLGVYSVVVTDKPNLRGLVDMQIWLRGHGVLPDQIIRSKDKTVAAQLARPGDIVVAVDDRIENVAEMWEAGIEAYLITQPWNKDANLPRIARLSELVPIVEDAQRRVG